jgi:hypothetical protein
VVFNAFTARLTVSSFQAKFTLLSNFTLGGTLNSIYPATQAVTLKIGTFTVTIPPVPSRRPPQRPTRSSG